MPKPSTNERQQSLRLIIQEKERQLESAPDGSLRVASIRGNERYYHAAPGMRQLGTYLGKKDLELAKALAQKSYDTKVLKLAEQELQAWQLLAAHFPDITVEEVYATLSPARQRLVAPICPTDEEFKRQWETKIYEPGIFKPDAPVYITDRGERVRSKSEQLIANMLYRLGIPYRYEYPIAIMVNGQQRIWRPDFTILDVKNRKEYYLEHFGMLDNDKYAKNAFGKMRIYEENGMFEGGNMIYSFETNEVPLDLQYLERKVRRTLGL